MDPHLRLGGGELDVGVVVIDAIAELHGRCQVEQGPQGAVDALVQGASSHRCHFPAAAALLLCSRLIFHGTKTQTNRSGPSLWKYYCLQPPPKGAERRISVPEPEPCQNTRCADTFIFPWACWGMPDPMQTLHQYRKPCVDISFWTDACFGTSSVYFRFHFIRFCF